MDDFQYPTPLASKSRYSALPRLSKLPLCRPPPPHSGNPRSPTPTHVSSSEEDPESPPFGDAPLKVPINGGGIVPKPAAPAISPTKRQPLGPPQRPQSKQEPTRPTHNKADGISRTVGPRARKPSQQENTLQLMDSSEESDAQSTVHLKGTPSILKRPQTSLVDRTLESISQISPSSTSNRRRSNFFNPQSPVTPTRPTTVNNGASATRMASNSSVTAPRSFGFARPNSPSKGAAASRRSISSALPRSNLPAANPITSTGASLASPKKTAATGIPSVHGAQRSIPSHGRSMSMIAKSSNAAALRQPQASQTGISSTRPKPAQQKTTLSYAPPKKTSLNAKPRKADGKDALHDTTETALTSPPNSSVALRAQIAKAKELNKNRMHQSKESTSTASTSAPSSVDLDTYEDPFNQKPKDGKELLRQRIEAARGNGRLNIAAMSLKAIPDEVLKMYDADQMEISSLSWNETVDLVRFCAADNEMEEIAENVFPDLTSEAFSDDSNAKGNQFAGVESLDLHGNLLKTVPIGLRRLERLTTLNLAHNKLDNSVFAILTQLHSLRTLDLSSNELTKDIPDSISLLFSLESLHLQSNKLSQFPASVRELTLLRTLDLSTNRLSDLPMESIGALPNLQDLNVSHNALTGAFFPLGFSGFSKLSSLDLSDNALASLTFSPAPPSLPALKNLNVSRNRLMMFPNIEAWTALKVLLAADNMLTALPEGFAKLSVELRSADFAGNGIRQIEDDVASMAGLEWLGLQGNPLLQKKYLTMNIDDLKNDIAKRLELDKTLQALTGGTPATLPNEQPEFF